MTPEKPRRATARETVVFYAKLAGFLLALAAFGFVVFLITKNLHIGRTH
jgi:hypothetical protein